VLLDTLRHHGRLIKQSRHDSLLEHRVQVVGGALVVTTHEDLTLNGDETFKGTRLGVASQKPVETGKVVVHAVMESAEGVVYSGR
jgi:hypothetical protein